MKRAAGTLALLALLLPLANVGARPRLEKRSPGMRWFTDLDAALREAKDRNIPVFVALHKDH